MKTQNSDLLASSGEQAVKNIMKMCLLYSALILTRLNNRIVELHQQLLWFIIVPELSKKYNFS